MSQSSTNPNIPESTVADGTAPGATELGTREAEEHQLDAANEALSRALAVSFNALRWIMLALIGVFLVSGFFTVSANEVAIRTRFGRIIPGPEGDVLHPEGGPYFRWPAPVGQVYRIPTATREVRIVDSFVFRAAHSRLGGDETPLSELRQGPRLDPQFDGALLTGDQSIVHARYIVSYKIAPEDAAKFVRNVASLSHADTEAASSTIFTLADDLVRNAVEQAIIEDVAGTPLDRFLRGGRSSTPDALPEEGAEPAPAEAMPPADPEAEPPVGEAEPQPEPSPEAAIDPANSLISQGGEEDRVRVKAQRVLEGLGSGITLVTVTRTEQMVASNVVNLNNAVAYELARARAIRNDAETQRNTALIATAGPAWEAILTIIDAYEEADRLRDSEPERFARAEQAILATFNGESLGPVIQGLASDLPEESPLRRRLDAALARHADERLRGQAGAKVTGAAAEASTYVATLEAEAVRFEAMLAINQERPDLVRQRLLTDTLRRIFSNPDSETTFLAPGANLRLLVNRERQAELEEEVRARTERFRETRGANEQRPAPGVIPTRPPQQPPPSADNHDH